MPRRSGNPIWPANGPSASCPPRRCRRGAAGRASARSQRLDLRAHRALSRSDCGRRRTLRPGHLSQPAGSDLGRADDGRLRQRGHARGLPPLELWQGIHGDGAALPARPHGPGLRDRHQLQSLHQLSDGGEHHRHAGPGDRPCGVRPQQLLQEQLPVRHVDGCGQHHRLPGLCARLHLPVRGAPWPDDGGAMAGLLPRAVQPGRGPLPPPLQEKPGARAGRARAARGLARSSRSTSCGAPCRPARARTARPSTASAFPRSPRKTCCTSSRRTPRCWSPGSARSCASCARSPSTSTRSARPR